MFTFLTSLKLGGCELDHAHRRTVIQNSGYCTDNSVDGGAGNAPLIFKINAHLIHHQGCDLLEWKRIANTIGEVLTVVRVGRFGTAMSPCVPGPEGEVNCLTPRVQFL